MKTKLHDRQHAMHTARLAGASKKALRTHRRRIGHTIQALHKCKRKRTTLLLHQQRTRLQLYRHRTSECRKRPIVATWNTRGFQANTQTVQGEIKLKCLIHRMLIQKWGCIVLTDIKGVDGTHSFSYGGRTWTLISRGKGGFLLEDVWTTWRRDGGSKVYTDGPRVSGIQFPRVGWRRGLYITGVYAPTSDSTVEERQLLRDQINQVQAMAQSTSIRLLAGDFNAELGNNQTDHAVGNLAVGPFGNPRVSTAGWEWRQWAETTGFRECASRFRLRHRWTWRHPRYQSEHELDHVFIHEEHLWHLVSCRILQEGPNVDNVEWPWSEYTDHNPVEITLRHGKMWGHHTPKRPSPPKPDVARMRGMSTEATRLRHLWVNEVETRLAALSQELPTLEARWEQISSICRDTAVQICGVLQKRVGAPWMFGREEEIKQLDQHIAQARAADRHIQHNPLNLDPVEFQTQKRRKRLDLRQARKYKRDQLHTWEMQWINAQAQMADNAAARHDMGLVFKVVKELANVEDSQRRFGRRTERHPEDAAEAWKHHFQQIQAGAGIGPEHVWADILPVESNADWLCTPPSHEEILKAIRDMEYGRVPGADMFMAEYLKLAGPKLLQEIEQVVTRAWKYSSEANQGEEAFHWPKKWKQGIIIPLWKKRAIARIRIHGEASPSSL